MIIYDGKRCSMIVVKLACSFALKQKIGSDKGVVHLYFKTTSLYRGTSIFMMTQLRR